jgi:Flp pilus assembly pilin Flp
MIRQRWKSEAGAGLVEVMIIGGIVAVILTAMSTGLKDLFNSAKKIDTSSEFTSARLSLSNNLSCSQTLPATVPPCVNGA